MRAIVYENYDWADVLELQEIEKPAHKENELLIN